MYYKSVLFLSIISLSSSSIVNFLPSRSFNQPSNFKDGKLPCSKETVVLPETLVGTIRLASKTSVSGIILPRYGDIYLDDATIEFGVDQADMNCTHEGNVYYLQKAVVSWWQADIWSSSRFNAATPDGERVPCFDDVVMFPSDAEFSLTLPDRTQFVAGIKIGDDSFTSETFKTRILEPRDQLFILNAFSETGLVVEQKQCLSRTGCPCQRFPLKIDCESKYCSVPTCVDPIKPAGHCCKICGGFIDFDIDESFDIMAFRELVEKIIDSYGSESLVYHIGRQPPNKIQLVVVDKVEYSGMSAEVVYAINNQMQRHWFQAKHVDISGSPLYKSGLSGKIFVSVFFLVIIVIIGIYVYYYKMPQIEVRFPYMNRNAPRVFTSFQSRTDSVVCLTRRDSEPPIGRSDGTAFRNPLYDSTRQRVEEEDTVSDKSS